LNYPNKSKEILIKSLNFTKIQYWWALQKKNKFYFKNNLQKACKCKKDSLPLYRSNGGTIKKPHTMTQAHYLGLMGRHRNTYLAKAKFPKLFKPTYLVVGKWTLGRHISRALMGLPE
jgi:hypothetical protein